MNEKVLVRRTGALGDVILTTPIIRQLKQDGNIVAVETGYPEVFLNNPHVDLVNGVFAYDRLIDLDLAYEKQPRMHILEAYTREAFGYPRVLSSCQQELFAINGCAPLSPEKPMVVLHAAVSWPSRTLPIVFWDALCASLLGIGAEPVFVGTGKDMIPTIPEFPRINDLRGKTSLHQLYLLLKRSRLFIGSDSAVLHVAGATDIPITGLFTSVNPAYRMPIRPIGWATAAIPDLDCVGCLAAEPAPATNLTCRRGDNACVLPGAFDAEEIACEAEAILRNT